MGEKYAPVVGDRVRVVLEGRVTDVSRTALVVGAPGKANHIYNHADHVVSIEKLEPPVVKFKPGDTVRSKSVPRWVYTVGENGYYDHEARRVYVGMSNVFNSRDYELVEQPS